MAEDERKVWSSFWTGGGQGSGSGFVPDGLHAIDSVQSRLWRDFARRLPKGAAVLDLATGDGAGLVKLAAGRPDLRLTGVDSAASLPKPPRGTTLRAGIAMERLPFPDGRFDAVISQFGIEYGDFTVTSAEAVRVLRPGGRLQFLIHHRDGAIVAHNAQRLPGLVWALDESGLWEKARQLIRARAIGRVPTPPLFKEALVSARARYAGLPAAALVAALVETLDRSQIGSPAEALEVLQLVEDQARNEIGRIELLLRVAQSGEQIAAKSACLAAAGLDCQAPEPIDDGAGRWIGWLVRARS